ncbi:hypothetical protein C9374_004816 [Naegleria lovaniensis]|uniref:Uncharacterized protein n=1 Tax=Naegleria lovaniensis TaxID=51637 RepID=A0AA88KII6_NAELO|nr:uncharacterized protein C9374_004816 [Naegleria lovaniensis]KAG2382849.1 hypothetical protein C9374_004816 [Naegleria lovaniensis]
MIHRPSSSRTILSACLCLVSLLCIHLLFFTHDNNNNHSVLANFHQFIPDNGIWEQYYFHLKRDCSDPPLAVTLDRMNYCGYIYGDYCITSCTQKTKTLKYHCDPTCSDCEYDSLEKASYGTCEVVEDNQDLNEIVKSRLRLSTSQQRGGNYKYQAIRSVCGPVDLAYFTKMVPSMLWNVFFDSRNGTSSTSITIPLSTTSAGNKVEERKCLKSLGARGEVINMCNNMDGTEWRNIVCNSTYSTRTNYNQAQCSGGVKFQYSVKLNECNEKFGMFICDEKN